MSDSTLPTATYDGQQEAIAEGGGSYVKMWLDAISLATAEEKDWRKEAEGALDVFRGKQSAKETSRTFNIFHSNIETVCPALYNSTPVPDVRRRYGDPDPIAKVVADILERSLSLAVENYDFDDIIKRIIRDGEITGRGVPRVRYVPHFGEDQTVVYEEVTCDYVPWRYFRRGPGRTWNDVPWVAFGDFLSKEQIAQLNPGLADKVPYNSSSGQDGSLKKAGTQEPSVFKRAFVWQVWDKDNRKVISVCPDYAEEVIAVVPDPLGLTGFFPVPRPYQPVLTTDSLVPITPYHIYSDLVSELNEVTARISRLVRQLRPRGGYGGGADDVKAIAEAKDGELVPIVDASMMMQIAQGGGLDKFIVWFPLEPTVKALAQLVQQRELIKQTIYEVTGLSDIQRGASDPRETAAAQQIKTQWGSLRVQDRQQEIARLIRDVFRMKAEILATKFSWETLAQMTGIAVPSAAERDQARAMVQQFMQTVQQAQASGQQPPQPPQGADKIKETAEGPCREEVEAVLRNDITRTYRIDVESDSTIRGDLTRNQQTMATFLQGTAQFAAAMGPLVQQSPEALGPVMEIYASFARQFKLGKQAEDALAKVTDSLRGGAGQQQKPPDPKVQAEQAKAQAVQAKSAADVQKIQLETQAYREEHQMKLDAMAREQELKQADFQLEAQRFELETKKFALKQQEDAQKIATQGALNGGGQSGTNFAQQGYPYG